MKRDNNELRVSFILETTAKLYKEFLYLATDDKNHKDDCDNTTKTFFEISEICFGWNGALSSFYFFLRIFDNIFFVL